MKSLLKTIIYRLLSVVLTVILVFIFSGEMKLATTIGMVDLFLKSLLYFLYEKWWQKLSHMDEKLSQ
jgi:uncharacterized membrane protein